MTIESPFRSHLLNETASAGVYDNLPEVEFLSIPSVAWMLAE